MEEMKNSLAQIIQNAVDNQENVSEIVSKIEVPKDKQNGDFAYPCFGLAKLLKKSPVDIAKELEQNIQKSNFIENVVAVNGYLNIYINPTNISNIVLSKILVQKENYGITNEGEGKRVIFDYSAPNIAKPFHLGHLATTIIGRTLVNIYKTLGYETIGINYLGDWGRQFGLLIEGYKRFGSEYEIKKDPLHILSEIYVRITKLAKEDEEVMDDARENFKQLEEGNEEYLKLWKYFRDISMEEYERIYKIIGCEFDSYNGEAYYNDKMDEVIEILDSKGVLKDSEGAKVVFVNENEPPCIILKSNGSTIYATRDLAAILERSRTYDYTKAIYVTTYEQIHHFKQLFEVAKNIVDDKYTKNLVHVPYGMTRLKTGKMSTRDGNVVYLQDLLEDAIIKAKTIIEEKSKKNGNQENIDLEVLANQIGVGAVVFNGLKNNKIKDVIFDLDEVLRFDGETGPYVQYTYVRTKSILDKCKIDILNLDINDIDTTLLKEEKELELIKALDRFVEVIHRVANEYEPSILSRYLIDISAEFSRFYNECTVLVEDEELKKARCALVYATSIVIQRGLSILGIECPERM